MSFSNQFNIKSCFNFLDSTIFIKNYFNFLKENDLNVSFICDDNFLYAQAEFYNEANINNIKAISGLSIENDQMILSLMINDYEGYKIINELSFLISNDNTKIDSIINEYLNYDKKHLTIIMTAKNNISKNIISRDNFFIGVTVVNFKYVNKIFNNFKKVFSNPIKYLFENEKENYLFLSEIKNSNNEKNTFHYLNDDEISEFISINDHKKNMEIIIENSNFNFFEIPKPKFIEYKTENNIDRYYYLESICKKSLEEYLIKNNLRNEFKVYKERLFYELETIKKMNFINYFLIVHDIVSEAEKKNILVGPGRGSAAGSLVSFLLSITKIDPIKYNLIFERFLNIDRVSMPDIDLDFEDSRREEVIEFLFEKYGMKNFASIISFQTIGIKNALRDSARILKIDSGIVDTISKLISHANIKTFEEIDHDKLLIQYKEKNKKLFEVAETFFGLPRQTGTHAAGIVFSNDDLINTIPIRTSYNGISQTQYSMNYLEQVGLIKLDLLGLRTLTTIQNILKKIKKINNIDIDLLRIPLDDQKTFNLLASGDTNGIFQLESKGMTDLLKKMNPKNILDIAVTSALFRPGPQENISLYLKRKNNKSFNLDDDILNELLKETFGIIIYQEQVMEIIKKVSNISLNKADSIRVAMAKKNFKLMDSLKDEFISGGLKNNFTMDRLEIIWNYINHFASYGFNKSHAISYSLISYWMAYLKANYKSFFYCELLNSVVRNEEKTLEYISEARTKNIKIIKPNVKNINREYVSKNNNIYMPLNTIKFIGQEFLNNINHLYKEDKNIFDSFEYFMSKMINNGINDQTYKMLVFGGAFDSFEFSRTELIKKQDEIFTIAKTFNKVTKNIFNFDLEKNTKEDLNILVSEKDALGFFIDNNFIVSIKKELKNSELLKELSHFNKPNIVGETIALIESVELIKDKNGKDMAFIKITDGHIILKSTVFNSTLKELKEEIHKNQIWVMNLKTQIYNDNLSGIINSFIKKIK